MAAFMPAAKPMLGACPVAAREIPGGAVPRASSRLPSWLPESTSAISAGGRRRAPSAAMHPARSAAESWVTRQTATATSADTSAPLLRLLRLLWLGLGRLAGRAVPAGADGRAGLAGSSGAAAELIVRQAAGQAPAGENAGDRQQQSGRGVAARGGPA